MKKILVGVMVGSIFFILSVIGGINSASALSLPTNDDLVPLVPPALPEVDFTLTTASGASLQVSVEKALEEFLKIPSVWQWIEQVAGQAGVTAPAVSNLATAMATKLRNKEQSWEAANAILSEAKKTGVIKPLLDIALQTISEITGGDRRITLPQPPQVNPNELKGMVIASADNVPLPFLKGQVMRFVNNSTLSADASEEAWNDEFNKFVKSLGSLGFDIEDSDVVKRIAAKTIQAQINIDPLVDSTGAETAIGATTGKMKAFLEAAL